MNKTNLDVLIDGFRKENKDVWNEIDVQSEIVKQIIVARLDKGISQEQLAEKTGLKQSAIARFESCKSSPRLDTIIKIIGALKLTMKIEYNSNCEQTGKVVRLEDIKAKYNMKNKEIYKYEGQFLVESIVAECNY